MRSIALRPSALFSTLPKHSLSSRERLKSRKALAALFQSGQTVATYPLRLVYRRISQEEPSPLRMAFTVPKRRFRKAVQRNRLRRQVKEAYRLAKAPLLTRLQEQKQQGLQGILIYTGKEMLSYAKIETAMQKILAQWQRALFAEPEDQDGSLQ